MTSDEIIAVVQAHKERKRIECRQSNTDLGWVETLKPVWNFAHYEYRVKPEPREFWLSPLSSRYYSSKQEALNHGVDNPIRAREVT